MRYGSRTLAVIALMFLSACATVKPTSPQQADPASATTATVASSPTPEILAVTTSAGKGRPWGRSDSDQPFGRLAGVATDPTYGLVQDNPVKVGGFSESNEAEFLNGLRGPEGQPVEYERVGSCCPFKTANAMIGDVGLLDAFRVTYAGQAQPAVIYIDFYDTDELQVPMGFSARKD